MRNCHATVEYSYMGSGVLLENHCHLTVCFFIKESMPLESVLFKEKAIHQFYPEMFYRPKPISGGPKDSGNVCYGQMTPDFSLFFGKKKISSPSSLSLAPSR